MIELSRTWANRRPEISMSLPTASPDATHSAARLDAVYMSGEYRRKAFPVEAHTTCGTPAAGPQHVCGGTDRDAPGASAQASCLRAVLPDCGSAWADIYPEAGVHPEADVHRDGAAAEDEKFRYVRRNAC
jgi:hypothetical protein